MDVRQHTASGDGHLAQQLAQLLVVANSQLDVTGDDTCLLVVPVKNQNKLTRLVCPQEQAGGQHAPGSIACQLQDLG